jgi:hypothetical protein
VRRLFIWLSEEEGWKAFLAMIYAIICIFDFVIVPSWIGITRQFLDDSISIQSLTSLEPSVQIKLIEQLNYQHQPFTLKGGGLFHLAFGALLTGSAIRGRIGK